MYITVRNIFLFLCLLALVNIGLFVFPRTISAQTNFASGNTVTLSKTQTIDEDYFASGGTVVISGTVNGDVYSAGGSVVINGIVNGDVLAAGGNVSVAGKVSGNVRVAGGQIAISGDVGKNVTATGGSIAIQDPAKIAGSLVVAGGNVSVLSPVGKGLTMAAGNMSIDAPVGGNVNGTAQTLTIAPDTRIAGKLTYWSTSPANIPHGSVMQGVVFHQMTSLSQTQQQQAAAAFNGFNIVWELVSLISSFIIGLLLLWFVPIYMHSIATTITTRSWVSVGVGFLTLIVVPIACIFLLLTIIGIPLAFILLVSFSLFVLLNKVFVSYAIGKKLLPQREFLALFVGLLIYSVISVIPIIGWIWSLIALFIGIGATILVEKELYAQARIKKLI